MLKKRRAQNRLGIQTVQAVSPTKIPLNDNSGIELMSSNLLNKTRNDVEPPNGLDLKQNFSDKAQNGMDLGP